MRGAWSDANPGAAPNGNPLSWSELVRKWGKHTGGSESFTPVPERRRMRPENVEKGRSTANTHQIPSSCMRFVPLRYAT